MKLELKHLAPYLPYNLNFYIEDIDGTRLDNWAMTIDTPLRKIIEFQNKPILHPLSYLTEEHANNCNYSHRDFKWEIINQNVPIKIWNDLLKNHWDVFELIPEGLAIDINTLD